MDSLNKIKSLVYIEVHERYSIILCSASSLNHKLYEVRASFPTTLCTNFSIDFNIFSASLGGQFEQLIGAVV